MCKCEWTWCVKDWNEYYCFPIPTAWALMTWTRWTQWTRWTRVRKCIVSLWVSTTARQRRATKTAGEGILLINHAYPTASPICAFQVNETQTPKSHQNFQHLQWPGFESQRASEPLLPLCYRPPSPVSGPEPMLEPIQEVMKILVDVFAANSSTIYMLSSLSSFQRQCLPFSFISPFTLLLCSFLTASLSGAWLFGACLVFGLARALVLVVRLRSLFMHLRRFTVFLPPWRWQ